MNIPRYASWAICAYVFYMIFFTMGCGSSDVGASMDTRTNPSIETLQGSGDAGQQFEPTVPPQSQSSDSRRSMPVTTASIGSAALVCSAAVPLVVVALLAWPRPHTRRNQSLREARVAPLAPVKRLTHR